MTKAELVQLETLLSKMNEEYGEEMHNDRYIALVTVSQTVNALILEGKHN